MFHLDSPMGDDFFATREIAERARDFFIGRNLTAFGALAKDYPELRVIGKDDFTIEEIVVFETLESWLKDQPT